MTRRELIQALLVAEGNLEDEITVCVCHFNGFEEPMEIAGVDDDGIIELKGCISNVERLD